MTEFEFLEAVYLASDSLATSAINFFTIFLAYVIAAHFAGKGLSSVVAGFVSIVYSLFLVGPSIGIIRGTEAAQNLTIQYHMQYPDGVLFPSANVGLSLLLVFTLGPPLMGWVGSLVYMHVVIRRST